MTSDGSGGGGANGGAKSGSGGTQSGGSGHGNGGTSGVATHGATMVARTGARGLPVPANLRGFIEVKEATEEKEEEEEKEAAEDGFSELRRPSGTGSNCGEKQQERSYPRLSSVSGGDSDYDRESSDQYFVLPMTPRGSSSAKEDSNGMKISKPTVVSASSKLTTMADVATTTSLTIEWVVVEEVKVGVENTMESTSLLRTTSTTKVVESVSPPAGASGESGASGAFGEPQPQSPPQPPQQQVPSSKTKSRKRSFTAPMLPSSMLPSSWPSLEGNEKTGKRSHASTLVFQVSWCVNGSAWLLEPTLVVATGMGSTKGRYTKENMAAAGEYQFRVRIHQPRGRDPLPWSESSAPFLFGGGSGGGSGSGGGGGGGGGGGARKQQQQQQQEVNDQSGGDSDDSGAGQSGRAVATATLRAPSMDEDGTLLEQIDPELIQFDDPLVVLGQGGFGIVSRSAVGGFRGITVAVKRVKPRAVSGLRNASDSERAQYHDEMLMEMLDELHAEVRECIIRVFFLFFLKSLSCLFLFVFFFFLVCADLT